MGDFPQPLRSIMPIYIARRSFSTWSPSAKTSPWISSAGHPSY